MRNIELDSSTTLSHILNELKTTEEDGLELSVVPGELTILENSLDRAIIEKVAKKFEKEIVFPASTIEEAPVAEDDNLGFVEGEDIISKAPMQEVEGMIKPAAAVAETSKAKRKFKLPFKLPKNKFIWLGVVIVTIFILLLSSVFFLPTAEVNLTVEGESKESQATITASPTEKEVNTEEKTVPLEFSEATKEDSDEASTTGKKTIGNPAKGRVNIFNRLSSGKNYPAGTVITSVATSSANVSFKLDSSVLVPAATPPGETSVGVNVTATKIGAEGNLSANSSFKVGSANVSEVYAKNDVAFSGGSTKEARVASAEDREKLKNKILDNLTEEAEKELMEKNEDYLIPTGSLETNITKETYDPSQVDAESEKLKATLDITLKAPLINKEDVQKLLISMLEKSDDKTKVDSDNIEIDLEQIEKNEDGSIRLLVKYKIQLVPEIDKNEISRQLESKSLVAASNYLDSLDKVSSYEVAIKPSIFRFLGFMPFSKDRIKINFKTN